MNWFKVEEKLPNHAEIVLVFTEERRYIVCIFVDVKIMRKELKEYGIDAPHTTPGLYVFCSQEHEGRFLNGITHWSYMTPPEIN